MPAFTQLAPIHLGLVLFAVANWGLSFVVIRVGLAGMPPFFFAALRFLFAAFPAMLFIKRPALPWAWLAAYGFAIGVLQFGVLFFAMRLGISAGMASLVIQSQAFFTVLLASTIFGEHLALHQWFGLLLASCGIGLIALLGGNSATPAGVGLTLVSGLGWAIANLLVRQSKKNDPNINMFALVIHGSAFSVLPLLLLSAVFDGLPAIGKAIFGFGVASGFSVLYVALVATVTCFGAWAWLIGRYGVGVIAPFGLLVPVFGMLFASIFLAEHFSAFKLLAASLVVLGLLVNTFGSVIKERTT